MTRRAEVLPPEINSDPGRTSTRRAPGQIGGNGPEIFVFREFPSKVFALNPFPLRSFFLHIVQEIRNYPEKSHAKFRAENQFQVRPTCLHFWAGGRWFSTFSRRWRGVRARVRVVTVGVRFVARLNLLHLWNFPPPGGGTSGLYRGRALRVPLAETRLTVNRRPQVLVGSTTRPYSGPADIFL